MHGYCLILRRRATHSDCRAAHCYHITTSPRCRASNGTSSPSYHITKSLTTQPTKHTTKSPTSHLPPQTHNTHQNISPHSHNTIQSTTTLSATYHHPISPKKSLTTQPAKLIDTQLIQNSNTHHTNKLTPPQKSIISQHNINHITPTTQTHNTHQEHFPSFTKALPKQPSKTCHINTHITTTHSKSSTQLTNTLLPTSHHTQNHIPKISNHPPHKTYRHPTLSKPAHTSQPTKHTTKPLTLHLPLQNLNIHPKASLTFIT